MCEQGLWLVHTGRDRERDREMMGFCITLCTVHTTQGQGTIGLHTHFPIPGPCPEQCEQDISANGGIDGLKKAPPVEPTECCIHRH